MDEMKITTNLMRGLVSKLISKGIKSKTNCNVVVNLNDLQAALIDGRATVHLDIDLGMTKEEFSKLVGIITR